MTIRQQGGIFGRNPTFNNLEVDGTMAVDGAMSVGGLTTFYNNVTISKTTGTALSLLDSDGGFAAATLTVENGGRDLAIFATQDIIFDQSGLETARFLLGGGLTFNGDTAAANALDDYEEGTWTGTYGGNTATGTYTKIGRAVYVDITLVANSASFSSITGLPYSAAGGGYSGGFSFGSVNRMDVLDANNVPCRISVSGTTINFTTNVATGASAAFTITSDASGTVRAGLSGVYYV